MNLSTPISNQNILEIEKGY